MLAVYKTVTGKTDKNRKGEKLFLMFFGEVFAIEDSKLSLWFNAAAFTCVLASNQWSKPKEGAFGA